jgi:hypothetical protein
VQHGAYVLCAITAFICGLLLLRSYRQKRVGLLLWCGIFFLALTVENVLLFVDLVMLPQMDLSLLRNSIPLIGVSALLYGLIMETR